MDDMCLLCLELRHQSVDCIYVNSRQWEEDNMEQLIEQHFWPMETIKLNSWICGACWHILTEFHQFYIRVEEAHVDMAMTMNTNQSPRQLPVAERVVEVADYEEMINKELSKQIEGVNIIINLNNTINEQEDLPFDQLAQGSNSSNVEQAQSMELAVQNYFHENVIHQEHGPQLEQVPANLSGFDAEYIHHDLLETSELVGLGDSDNTELLSDLIQLSQLVEVGQESQRLEISGLDTDHIHQELPNEQILTSGLVQAVKQKMDGSNDINQQSRRFPEEAGEELHMDPMQTQQQVEEDNDITKVKFDNEEPITDNEDSRILPTNCLKKALIPKSDQITATLVGTGHLTTELFENTDYICEIESENVLQVTPDKMLDKSACIVNPIQTPQQPNDIEHNFEDDQEIPIDYPSDNNNSNSDDQTDNDSAASDKQKSRLTRQNYDAFLSEHFKMYCSICQEAMRTFNELRKHFAKVHNRRGYVKCCDRQFMRRSNLVEHIRWHCEPNNFKCKYCGKVMSNKRCLSLHEKHVHEKDYIKHQCDVCEKFFASANVLKNHKLTHLSDDEKKFRCDECDKKFGSNTLLSNHIRSVHMSKYIKICDICGKKLRCRNDFERHALEHKGVPLPYLTCDVCGLKLTNKSGLKRHKSIQHPEGGKKEYKCHICSKVSDSLSALRGHIQYKHEMARIYKCTVCSKSFKKHFTLNEHMAGHAKKPLYSCPYCPKTFNSNANMHSHRKKNHPLEWLEDRRKKYSGHLPPNFKPPSTVYNHIGYPIPEDSAE